MKSISVTMRTPGHDFELAAGFLLTEGVVSDPADTTQTSYVAGRSNPAKAVPRNRRWAPPSCRISSERNTVQVKLAPNVSVSVANLERNFYTSNFTPHPVAAFVERTLFWLCARSAHLEL